MEPVNTYIQLTIPIPLLTNNLLSSEFYSLTKLTSLLTPSYSYDLLSYAYCLLIYLLSLYQPLLLAKPKTNDLRRFSES